MVTALASDNRDWSLGSQSEVLQGDAFELVGKLPDASVDLVLTSPPYWGQRSYGLESSDNILEQWKAEGVGRREFRRIVGIEMPGVLGLEPFPNWFVEHLVEFFSQARSKLKASGSLWVNLGDTYWARWGSIRDGGRQGIKEGRQRRKTPSGGYLHDKQLLLVPARFAIAMQDAGWILRNDLIWAKPHVLPRPETDRLRLSHEHWLHFVLRQPRNRPKYYYDLTSCEDGALDVVIQPTVKGSDGHTATFPPSLIRPRILSSCPPGGLLLDPFCGTGRAISEAVRLRRRGLGFEISPLYAAAADRHLTAAFAETGDENAIVPED